ETEVQDGIEVKNRFHRDAFREVLRHLGLRGRRSSGRVSNPLNIISLRSGWSSAYGWKFWRYSASPVVNTMNAAFSGSKFRKVPSFMPSRNTSAISSTLRFTSRV